MGLLGAAGQPCFLGSQPGRWQGNQAGAGPSELESQPCQLPARGYLCRPGEQRAGAAGLGLGLPCGSGRGSGWAPAVLGPWSLGPWPCGALGYFLTCFFFFLETLQI